MRAFLPVLVLILTLNICYAADDWVYSDGKALLIIEISERAKVVRFEDSSLEYVRASIDFFPRDDNRQQVKNLITFPEYRMAKDVLSYEWKSPAEQDLSFSVYSHVLTRNYVSKIDKKIDFPLLYVDSSLDPYTDPSRIIDSDNLEIRELAQSIAQGEDDYFEVVFKIAEWVRNNVEYKSTSETFDLAQKASWVMDRRIGVCDELTTLFAAMARSLGIPVKFVNGFAYGKTGQGPHAWAEVYFPDFGWIPFDVTYGEYGYLDVSHVKLKESVDADVPSARFEWRGKNVELDTQKLEITSEVLSTEERLKPLVQMTISPYSSGIGLESYNLIQVKILNNNPYYVAVRLEADAPEELQISSQQKIVLLHPYEEKAVYWIVKPVGMTGGYSYQFPFVVYTYTNYSVATNFKVGDGLATYSKQEMESILETIDPKKPENYSSRLLLKCVPKYRNFYVDEPLLIDCFVFNAGNARLPNVYVCHESACQNTALAIAEKKKLSFEVGNKGQVRPLFFAATAGKASANDSFRVSIIDRPKVFISEVQHPKKVAFNQDYFVKFSVNKDTYDSPKKMLVLVDTEATTKSWEVGELNQTESFIAELKGKSLRNGKNDIKIFISYYDDRERRYDDLKETEITLENLTIGARLSRWFGGFRQWVFSFFD